jgi:phosphatidylinositol alpha-1,6-mannosyltransferase
MRILALVTDAFGGEGGIAQANRDLFEVLANLRPENLIIILPRIAKKMTVDLSENIQQTKPVKNRILYSLGSLRLLYNQGPFDMIFCGHLFMAPLVAILSIISRVPFWIHIHGIEAWKNQSRLIQWAVKKAKLITAISRCTRRRFMSVVNVAPERVRILPDTVSEKFRPGSKPAYLIERYGLKGKRVLLTVGRLSHTERYKGHDKVIAALPRLLERHPNLIYVVAGDGDDRPRLEILTKEFGVTDKVFFIGWASDSELVDVYRLADLFVMPSTGEGFGIVFLEAAASGIPVIGGDEDGSLDALLEGRIGRAVNTDNKDELCKAILDGLGSKIVGKENVERFSKVNFSSHVRELLKEIINVAK